MKSQINKRIGWAFVALVLGLPLFVPLAGAQTLTLSTESESAKQHFWMGMKDFDNVFTSRAAEHFTAALSADPNLAIAEAMFAFVAPGLSASERDERMDAALGKIATTSAPELLFASAFRRQLAGDAVGAQALFSAAAGLVPDDPTIANRVALFAGTIGSPERVAALTDVTERFPDHAAAFNQLAYDQWNAGDEAGGRRNVVRYMELLPDHPNSHDSVAELMQFSGLFAHAMQHYDRAISLDADYFAGYTGLAEARILSGDANGARAALDQARNHAASDQQRANVTRFVANTYFFEGDGAVGLRTLKQAATEAEATNGTGVAAQIHRELAMAEALFGSTENIPMHIELATELAPNNVNNQAWAGLAYGVAGNADAARRAARAFEESSSGSDFTRVLDALVALAEGQHSNAESLLLESDLNDPWARAFLVRCLNETGHTTEARALESEVMADHQFTVANFTYTLSRLTLVANGVGQVRDALGGR